MEGFYESTLNARKSTSSARVALAGIQRGVSSDLREER